MPIIDSASAAFPTVRRYALLIGGILGLGYETLYDKAERPVLLLVFSAMLGLSEIVHAFWKAPKGGSDDE